jgi:hypothetical protein
MKKLIYRKVNIVKAIPTVDLNRWFSPREIAEFEKGIKQKKKPLSLKLKEQKERERFVKWFVLDKVSKEELARFDSYDQAKQFCIKKDYDFGQYV